MNLVLQYKYNFMNSPSLCWSPERIIFARYHVVRSVRWNSFCLRTSASHFYCWLCNTINNNNKSNKLKESNKTVSFLIFWISCIFFCFNVQFKVLQQTSKTRLWTISAFGLLLQYISSTGPTAMTRGRFTLKISRCR